ncbi:MAG: Ig-like domain-containing protein [Mycoplasmoidaceae bacterium]
MKKIISLFTLLPTSCLVTTGFLSCTSSTTNNNINLPQESVFKIINPRTMFNPNDTYQFKAEYTIDSNNEDKTTWTSSNPNIATIDEEGNFTALKEGATYITATWQEEPKPSDRILVNVSSTYKKLTFNNMQTKAMTVDCHDMIDNDGNPFIIRFISATYEKGGGSRPIHNQLKMSDIEIVYQGSIINSNCTLAYNKLTIPAQYTNDAITINYLGSEIADWITWNDIMSISNEDVQNEDEKDTIKEYFLLGDYKKVYRNGGYFSRARIVDFYHDTFLGHIGDIDKEVPVPTTWEMYDDAIELCWGCTETPYANLVWYGLPYWGSDKELHEANKIRDVCEYEYKNNFTGLETRETIKCSEGNDDLKSEDHFFVGSLAEYTGQIIEDITQIENIREEYKGKDGEIYAFFDPNAFISTQTTNQARLIKSRVQHFANKNDDDDDANYYFTRLPWRAPETGTHHVTYGDEIVLINLLDGSICPLEHKQGNDHKHCAFLMFCI